ncbi:MAG: transporter [Acidobacteria bacterium]|nr:transporter [Acidobacteriota bacterium]
MAQAVGGPAAPIQPFPGSFWTANVTELFERAAYYSMASFVVIYLGQLGFGESWPSFLNSTVLWGLVYFLPILSGTIADQIGFRRALLIAFVLLSAGYLLMGYPVWFGGSALALTIGREVTASTRDIVVIVAAILLIGVGGSVIKPCISGTVQKTAGARATLGFAIFYMVINIGSLFGRGTAFVVRSGSGVETVLLVVAVCSLAAAGLVSLVYWTTKAGKEKVSVWIPTIGFLLIVASAGAAIFLLFGARAAERGSAAPAQLSYIFAVSAVASAVAFFVVLLAYREPAAAPGTPTKPKRSVGRILADMVLVLGSLRFALFLVVMSGFFFIYNQVYNVIPLYAKRVVETNPAMDLYTAANPFVIVCLQLLISRTFGKLRPIRSMIFGTVIISVAMVINLLPLYTAGGIRAIAANWLPIASVFIVLTVALIAIGELFTSPRMYEYIGALAPKGQEGLFLGYANLPLALGSMVGGPVGAFLFNRIMAKNAATLPNGLLELDRTQNMLGWLILMGIGLVSAAALWQFNRWIDRPAQAVRKTDDPGRGIRPEAGAEAKPPATITALGGLCLALAAWSLAAALALAWSTITGSAALSRGGAFSGWFVACGLIGWTVLQASVGLKMMRRRSWARGVFIVAFPTLWALSSTWFSSAALLASVAVWLLGMWLLTRRSAMEFFAED